MAPRSCIPSWALGLALSLAASGCYCSHDLSPDAGASRDAGPDAGPDVGMDAGPDSGVDAGPPWMTPPGVCELPEEERLDRFPGDSQEARDHIRVQRALYERCHVSEGSCASARYEVGADGRITSVTVLEEDPAGCIEEALLDLCVPALAGDPDLETFVCGV